MNIQLITGETLPTTNTITSQQVIPMFPKQLNELPVGIYGHGDKSFVGITTIELCDTFGFSRHSNIVRKVESIIQKWGFGALKTESAKNQNQLTFGELLDGGNESVIYKKSTYLDRQSKKRRMYIMNVTAMNLFFDEYRTKREELLKRSEVNAVFHQLQNRLNQSITPEWAEIRAKSISKRKELNTTISKLWRYCATGEEVSSCAEGVYHSTITRPFNQILNGSTKLKRSELDFKSMAIVLYIETLLCDFIEAMLANGTYSRREIKAGVITQAEAIANTYRLSVLEESKYIEVVPVSKSREEILTLETKQ